jgi:hypothetical protein
VGRRRDVALRAGEHARRPGPGRRGHRRHPPVRRGLRRRGARRETRRVARHGMDAARGRRARRVRDPHRRGGLGSHPDGRGGGGLARRPVAPRARSAAQRVAHRRAVRLPPGDASRRKSAVRARDRQADRRLLGPLPRGGARRAGPPRATVGCGCRVPRRSRGGGCRHPGPRLAARVVVGTHHVDARRGHAPAVRHAERTRRRRARRSACCCRRGSSSPTRWPGRSSGISPSDPSRRPTSRCASASRTAATGTRCGAGFPGSRPGRTPDAQELHTLRCEGVSRPRRDYRRWSASL